MRGDGETIKMYVNKTKFVKEKLEPLLRACRLGVISCDYYVDGMSNYEIVCIKYDDNRPNICVNVNYDSNITIVKDVFRALGL